MPIRLARICRYPVKGLSAEDLSAADLAPDRGLPEDRRFALALPSHRFDPDHPQWLPKTSFLMLQRDEKLAALQTAFDPETGVLTVLRRGKQVSRGKITEALGRAVVEDFFAAYTGGPEGSRGVPSIVEGLNGHMFSDHVNRVVSIVNLASVRDLERVVGQPVDPLRFRANLYLDGAEPWAEFDWVGRALAVGAARLAITARIDRCAATNVNPDTGERDMNIPKALQRGFGHVDFGVYGAVVTGGPIAVGDPVTVAGAVD